MGSREVKLRRKTTKEAPAKPKITFVPVPFTVVEQAIDALDGSEQLLELLKGTLNGECEGSYNELLTTFQDYVIVSARVRLHESLKAAPTEKPAPFRFDK